MLKRAPRKGGTARTTAAKGGDEVMGTNEGLSNSTLRGSSSHASDGGATRTSVVVPEENTQPLARVHVDAVVVSLSGKNTRKAFQRKHTEANAHERQTTGTRTSETTPIRPNTNSTRGSPRMAARTGSRYTHAADIDDEQRLTTTRRSTAVGRTRGRLAAETMRLGGRHSPKGTHAEKKGPTLLRGKTSGETRHDYENVGGLGDGREEDPWHAEVTNELNKEDRVQTMDHMGLQWRDWQIERGQSAFDARRKGCGGHTRTSGHKHDTPGYKKAAAGMTPMVVRGCTDGKKGKAPRMGRQAERSDKLGAPGEVHTGDFESRSPAKRKLMQHGRSRCQRKLAGEHPAAANFDAGRHRVKEAGGSDDSGSNDTDTLGNHGTGNGRETANPVRRYKGYVATYKEDADNGACGHDDKSRDGDQRQMSKGKASAENRWIGMGYREEACWDSSTSEEGESEATEVDDSSVEHMDSDSELEDIFNLETDILDVPTQVARRLLHRDNGAEDRKTLVEVVGCIRMRIRMTEGSETHQATVTT